MTFSIKVIKKKSLIFLEVSENILFSDSDEERNSFNPAMDLKLKFLRQKF